MNTNPVQSTRYAVLGSGLTGRSVVEYLCSNGYSPVVLDEDSQVSGLQYLRQTYSQLEYRVGNLKPDSLDGIDCLVVSPGVSMDREVFAQIQGRGIRVISDIELFTRNAQAPIIGVTGTNGKSTVTELLHRMALHCDRRAALGGNRDVPALQILDDSVELYTLELSSFQLQSTFSLRLLAGCVLNISEDHLDRHGSLLAYRNIKHRVYQAAENAISNRNDPLTQPLLPASVNQITFGSDAPESGHWGVRRIDGVDWICTGTRKLMRCDDLGMQSRTGVLNAAAALALASVAGLNVEKSLEVLRGFAGLPHCVQPVAEMNGVSFVNDSKATNPMAVVAALEQMGQRPVRLICGGNSKGCNYEVLRLPLARKVVQMLVIGDQGEALAAVAGEIPVARCQSLEAAVQNAWENAHSGDIVLLAPACSSLDMFTSYQERGEVFERAVNTLGQQ